MSRIATLGPKETFSEIAATRWGALHSGEQSIQLHPSFRKVFEAVGSSADYGIFPIENMVEGYVQQVLDLLLGGSLTIIDELLLPIQFSFVSQGKSDELTTLYAQFVTQGQCSEFLDTHDHCRLITTESNGESVGKALKAKKGEGALVPHHALKNHDFATVKENVNDFAHNQTRFIVVAPQGEPLPAVQGYKTSIVIVEGVDRPGMLSDILRAFAQRGVNLGAIISRPTKAILGKYHFFIDIEGHYEDEKVADALREVCTCGEVKILGSYPRGILIAER